MEPDPNLKPLNERQKKFCLEYIFDWDQLRAYKSAFKKTTSDRGASASASKLLTLPKIQAYISELQKDIEKQTRTSKQRIIRELEKIAYNNISAFHNTWITRFDFEEIPEEDRAAIAEISTKVVKVNQGTKKAPNLVDVEYVKLKLHDKNKALEQLSRILGYEMPKKFEIGGNLVLNCDKTDLDA